MLSTALKPPAEVTAFPPTVWPEAPRWANFRDAVQFIPFGRYFVNSLIVTLFGTVGTVGSSFIIAYGLSRIRWPGRELVFYIVIASIFIYIQFPVNPVTMIPLFTLFASLGWTNTFLPLIVPTFFGNPFYIFLLRQFLMQIPFELSEAAKIDGANEFQVLRFIVLPLSLPAIAVASVLTSVTIWNDFLGPLIYLYDQNMYTLAVGLSFYQSTYEVQWQLLMAASTLVLLPELILFLLFQRAFIRGITIGSLK
ncbi:MAG: carbohydrate ABC transporter permease [Trueperaceae bacterium]|nr:carbohydrate ABC transporter permease [Trueperaceae bacterium]